MATTIAIVSAQQMAAALTAAYGDHGEGLDALTAELAPYAAADVGRPPAGARNYDAIDCLVWQADDETFVIRTPESDGTGWLVPYGVILSSPETGGAA